MACQQPFEDLKAIVNQLPPMTREVEGQVAQLISSTNLTADTGLLSLAVWIADCQNAEEPVLEEMHIGLLASTYKHAAEQVGPVKEYIARAARGMTPVNELCVEKGVGMRVIEMAPDIPHSLGGQWTEQDCMAAIAFGMEAAASGGHLLGVSDLAPCNEVNSIALMAYCLNISHQDLVTTFASRDEESENNLLQAAAHALSNLNLAPGHPLQALQVLGGREIAGGVGALIAARSMNIPVLVDNWGMLASMAVLKSLRTDSLDHIQVAGVANDIQLNLCRAIGKQPIVGHFVGLGPGCAIATAISILFSAGKIFDALKKKKI